MDFIQTLLGTNDQDYRGAAQDTAQADALSVLRQLYANRPEQETPWGLSSWSTSPYTTASGDTVDKWKHTLDLTPEGQETLDAQVGTTLERSRLAELLSGRLRGELGQEMPWDQIDQQYPMGGVPGRYELDAPWLDPNLDFSGASALPGQTDFRSLDLEGLPELRDLDQLRGDVTDQYYEQGASRLDPQWENRRNQLDIRMRSQGLQPGDEQYNRRMRELEQGQTDAYNQLQYSATQAGGQEFDRQRGADLERRNQFLGERTAELGSFNQAGKDQFMQQMQMRGLTTSEAERMWGAYNQTQMQQLGANQSVSEQNFGQNMQQSQYATLLRQQAIAEQMQKRGFSVNEINALLSQQQIQQPQMPNFYPAGKSEAPDYLGASKAEWAQDLGQAKAQGQFLSGVAGGLGDPSSFGAGFQNSYAPS